MSRVGVYWSPGHNRPVDMDYMRRLQPTVIRILDPDVQHIIDAHKAAPHAVIMPRLWLLDDNNGEQKRQANMYPIVTGRRHATEWNEHLAAWHMQAQERGEPWPECIIVSGVNEPNDGLTVSAQVEYNVAFLDECKRYGIHAAALCLGVGWPANTGPDTPPDWTPYEPVRDAIKRGGHILDLHEYWYSSPTDGWGWLAGRHTKLPDSWDVPMVIGECGVDRYVDAERWQNEGGNRGWRGNLPAWEYAADLDWFAEDGCDERVLAVLPFSTDYRANDWESFDTLEAHDDIVDLAYMTDNPPEDPPVTVHLPHVTQHAGWEQAIDWIFSREGGFQKNEHDKGNYYNGDLVGTKYGISAATWGGMYDIPNLTKEQAEAIYRQYYWQASGADQLPWPLSLLVFDTAVLHGVGAATTWLRESGPDPLAFAAKRLRVYTAMDNWQHFGAGWINRMAELLEVVSND